MKDTCVFKLQDNMGCAVLVAYLDRTGLFENGEVQGYFSRLLQTESPLSSFSFQLKNDPKIYVLKEGRMIMF